MSDVVESIIGSLLVIFVSAVAFVVGGIVTNAGCKAMRMDYENRIEYYEQILDDPHHCVSVCAEQFEDMGC